MNPAISFDRVGHRPKDGHQAIDHARLALGVLSVQVLQQYLQVELHDGQRAIDQRGPPLWILSDQVIRVLGRREPEDANLCPQTGLVPDESARIEDRPHAQTGCNGQPDRARHEHRHRSVDQRPDAETIIRQRQRDDGADYRAYHIDLPLAAEFQPPRQQFGR